MATLQYGQMVRQQMLGEIQASENFDYPFKITSCVLPPFYTNQIDESMLPCERVDRLIDREVKEKFQELR